MKEVLETTTLSHPLTNLINAQSHFTISEEDVISMDISSLTGLEQWSFAIPLVNLYLWHALNLNRKTSN